MSRIADVCLILGIVLIVIAVFAYVYGEIRSEMQDSMFVKYWIAPYRQYTFPIILGAIILSITGLACLIAVTLYREPKEQQS